MGKIFYIFIFCLFVSGCTVNPNRGLNYYDRAHQYSAQSKTCKESNYQLTKNDENYKNSIDQTLELFGGLSLKDLDAEYCLDKDSVFDNTILVNKYYQLNQRFLGNRIHAFTAYDYKSHKSVAIILDNNLNTYIVGSNDEILTNAAMSLIRRDQLSSYVDLKSTKVFKDLLTSSESNKVEQNSEINSRYSVSPYTYSSPNYSYKYTPSANYGSKTVHVNGYTRRDGTYVRPHTRSAPRSRK
ncbi:hypothetical protein I6M90_16095 [Acinetobacter bereziniae]|uniref:hypothetical protein n=1 Tax=Acinetobacter bereziniae TaxID=106648 RepID=UPI0019012D25|nr:hypothetical protein [Acinetobacter bereziniae]MBJ8452868.1 hypothetical protein [Acinetobacter bereziniae]MBJ8457578.1 hypothetical protein [Acinetobacter bereziniae]